MALILGIETSSKNCSVVLINNGEIIASKESAEGLRHAEKLHPFVSAVIEESPFELSDLQGLILGDGPGSFTGLRIGASGAKGFCFSLSIPLMTYSSLANMALQVNTRLQQSSIDKPYMLCSLIDARRMEVYCAVYDNNMNELQHSEAMVIDEHSFQSILNQGDVYFFGDGMSKVKALIESNEKAHFIEDIFPTSMILNQIAEDKFQKEQFEDTAYYEPFYLKGVYLTTPKKQL